MTFQLMLTALACSLEPLPLSAFILTLSTKAGVRNGIGFLAGWVLTLILVIVVTLAVTGGSPPSANSVPSNGVLVAKILLGVGLLVFAWRYRARPQTARPEPGWMKRMDSLTIWGAAALAFLLQPWGLVAAAALSITEADASKASDRITLVAFVVLATISLAAMQTYVMLSPEQARRRLDGLRTWLDGHRSPIVVTLAVVVGAVLVVRAAVALAS